MRVRGVLSVGGRRERACDDRWIGAGGPHDRMARRCRSRAHAVQIVEGGEDSGPLAGRGILAELPDAGSVDTARVLTTTGRLIGDMCRCHGGPTIVLRDVAGEVLASAGLHGHGSVSWERSRFCNDLVVADPGALHLFLAGLGVPDQLTSFLAPLADLLNLREGRPQFRPAGREGKRYLIERGVPSALHPVLVAATGQQCGELSDTHVDDVRRRLTAATPSATGRAAILLSWLAGSPFRQRHSGAKVFWCGSYSPISRCPTSRPQLPKPAPATSQRGWSTWSWVPATTDARPRPSGRRCVNCSHRHQRRRPRASGQPSGRRTARGRRSPTRHQIRATDRSACSAAGMCRTPLGGPG